MSSIYFHYWVVEQMLLKYAIHLIFCLLGLVLLNIWTHCGLVTPYGNRDLGQHWIRQWFVAWWHQAIIWTNVDWSSVKSSDIHIRAISQEMPQPSITKICLKISCLKFCEGTNELHYSHVSFIGEMLTVYHCKLYINYHFWENILCRNGMTLSTISWFDID